MSDTETRTRPAAPAPLDLAGKSTLEILAQIDIFAGLPPVHLRRVVDIGVEEQYKSGATVFSEGEAGDKFYQILEGAVRISRFVPGVGEEDLEDLLFVDRDLAYELLWNFVRTLSRRLRATNDKMTFLATTSKF